MYIWTCSKPYTMYTTTANVYSFEKSQLNGRRSGVEKMFGWFWNHALSSSAVNQDLLGCGTFSWIRDYLFQVRIRKKWQINNQNFMSFCLKKRDTSWLILLFQNSKKTCFKSKWSDADLNPERSRIRNKLFRIHNIALCTDKFQTWRDRIL